MKEKIEKLLCDKAFVEELNAAETEDDVIVLFSENGVDTTFEFIHGIVTALPGGKAPVTGKSVIHYEM